MRDRIWLKIGQTDTPDDPKYTIVYICEQSVWNFLFFAVLSSVSLILRCSTLNLIIMCHFRKLKTPSVTVTYETIIFFCALSCIIKLSMDDRDDGHDGLSQKKTGFVGLKTFFNKPHFLLWQQHSCPHAKLLLSIHHHFNMKLKPLLAQISKYYTNVICS